MWNEIARLVRHAGRPERLYPIRTAAEYGHYAGRLPDGRQALVTCDVTNRMCVFLFSEEGDYLDVERRTAHLTVAFDDADARAREVTDYLAREFGFTPGMIRVRGFCEATEMVSIEALPDHLAEFATDPEGVDPERRTDLLEDLRQWVEEDAFVLNTWNDYYLDADGEVTSS